MTNLGWLASHHTFSFGDYRDPQQHGFSDLLVLNDDRVQPARGFESHEHQDMEIFSYVLDGALEHKDSTGIGSVIFPGDVQIMSAGSGIWHSEFNHSRSDLVHFLQIWIVPAHLRMKPRYQQKNFSDTEERGKLRLIISPDGADGSLSVHQDVKVYAGLFDGAEKAALDLGSGRFAYVHIARGSLSINGKSLAEGDGIRIRNEKIVAFSEGKDSEILAFNLRPHELPRL